MIIEHRTTRRSFGPFGSRGHDEDDGACLPAFSAPSFVDLRRKRLLWRFRCVANCSCCQLFNVGVHPAASCLHRSVELLVVGFVRYQHMYV